MTLSGHVNIFGSGITVVSGDLFVSSMVGTLITVNGHNYNVVAVQDGQNATLDNAIEIASNVAWIDSAVPDPPPPPPPATSPLTLSCFCPGNPLVKGCELISLTLHMDVTVYFRNGESAIGAMRLTCGVAGTDITDSFPTPGTTSHDYPLSLLAYYANWSSIVLFYWADSSLLQINPAGGGGVNFSFYIDQEYLCQTGDGGFVEKHVHALNLEFCDPHICTIDGADRASIEGGSGSGAYSLALSTPLGGAFCECFASSFDNNPGHNTLNGTTGGEWCLCAAGGVAPYVFSIISGQLPCGQTLNSSTGCIEGDIDGTCAGTQQITFRVTDQQGSTADVTCNVGSCPTTSAELRNWAA